MGKNAETEKKQVRKRVKKEEPEKVVKKRRRVEKPEKALKPEKSIKTEKPSKAKKNVNVNEKTEPNTKERVIAEPAKPEPSDGRSTAVKLAVRIIVLVLEIFILAAVILSFIYYRNKLKNEDYSEESLVSGIVGIFSADDEEENNGVNVNNDKFELTVTKLQLTDDTEGNPAAFIFFTFVNKTSEPLCMSEVFPPSVMQNDMFCETFASILEPPEEFYNKDLKISDGASVNVCYTVKLQDKTSDVVLTIHDNYEKFKDIGSVTIPLQSQ